MKLLLIGIFLTELIKYGVWFKGIHGLSFSRWRLGSIVAGMCVLLTCLGIISEDVFLIFWNIVAIIVYGIMIQCHKSEKGLFILQAAFIVTSIGEVVGGIIQMVSDKSAIKVSKFTYLLSNIIIILIFSLLSLAKRWIKSFEVMKTGKIYRGVLYSAITLMGVVILLAVTGFQSIARFVGDDRVNIFSRITSIVAYICIVCLVVMISYVFNENKRYKLYLEKEAMLVKMQKDMYEAMLLKNEETKNFRHDIKNHFICLNEFAECGELSKVRSYIADITGKLCTIQGKMYTVGNDVVDVVLNYYISMLPEKVKVSIEGICTSKIAISDFELCTVISNLIQNAEEALKKDGVANPYLRIEFGHVEDYIKMKISNSIIKNSVVLEGKSKIPKTTKQNENQHGIGLCNTIGTLKRNGGMLDIEVSANEFSAMVMLPIRLPNI